ncbi:hypothetical protein A0H81_01389 [Grifola frondosa]|uniref:F-box domain-containing protein n=1 Tax=Grifola frondosa TaxID=5627 RepID=A0A1C7MT57_GRIFR|nr:hypothetical protein A0H81_01389 [Grifola frondosa]
MAFAISRKHTQSLPQSTLPGCLSCPINNLPVEMLEMMFIWWTEVDEDAPWIGSSVCQYWRTIILTCPLAWSRIHVKFRPPPLEMEKDEAWCIEEGELENFGRDNPRGKPRPFLLWIERAGTTDLTLSVTITLDAPSLCIVLVELTSALADKMARVRRFELYSDTSYLAFEVMSRLWHTAPSLRYLTVVCSEMYWLRDMHDNFAMWDVLKHAPLLETLDCRGCYPIARNNNYTPHVRRLIIANISAPLRGIIAILRTCGSLEFLQLSSLYGDTLENIDPVDLPRLEVICMERTTMECCERFFPCIVTSNLRQLSLRCDKLWPLFSEEYRMVLHGVKSYDAFANFGNVFVAFAARSPRLESLYLSSVMLPDRYILSALRHLPDLVELHLNNLLVGVPAFRGLIPMSGSPSPRRLYIGIPVCPRLARLTLSNCDLLPGDALVEFIRARAESDLTTSVKYLDVDECERIEEEHVSLLRDIAGLEIRFVPCERENVTSDDDDDSEVYDSE